MSCQFCVSSCKILSLYAIVCSQSSLTLFCNCQFSITTILQFALIAYKILNFQLRLNVQNKSYIIIQFKMSKAPNKTRKKKPNLKLTKNSQIDTDQQQQKIASPQLRILQAKKILLGQELPSKFKFREKELAEIETMVKNLMNQKKANACKIIMVTGSPGAGKTLCVNNVLHKLQTEDYQVIALNSNMIKKKKDVQSILASELLGLEDLDQKNLTTFKITDELEKSKVKKCILYVQEVELFFNSHIQFLSQDFFDIFRNKNLKILLLGISNTIDALQKYGSKMNIQVDQVTNIVFNPYSIDQLKQIIVDKFQQMQKVTGIHLKYNENLIKFAANKINELKKGDMRMVFQFLKNLTISLFPSQFVEEIPQEIPITIQMINRSFCDLNIQLCKIIQNLPFNQKVVLIAIYNYLLETEQISISEDKLKQKVNQMYNELDIDFKKSYLQEIDSLSNYNLVQIKPKNQKQGIKSIRYLLKTQMSEIKYCFQDHPILGKLV